MLIEIGIAIEIEIGSIGEAVDNDPDPDPDPDFDFDFDQAPSGCTAKTLRICNTSGSSRIASVALLALESLAGPIRP